MTKFKELKKAYINATTEKKDIFEIDGHQFVVGYAKYLIEHLENQKVKDFQEINFVPTGDVR